MRGAQNEQRANHLALSSYVVYSFVTLLFPAQTRATGRRSHAFLAHNSARAAPSPTAVTGTATRARDCEHRKGRAAIEGPDR